MRYHMRRTDREIGDPAEQVSILRAGRYAVVALCKDDEPYLVTMNYGYDADENALYFHCAPEGQKIDFLRSNPQVCGTVIDDRGYVQGECAHEFRSVVFRGTLRLVAGLEEKMHGMEVMLRHLEDDPSVVRQRSLKDERAYERAAILRLDVSEITGKQGR